MNVRLMSSHYFPNSDLLFTTYRRRWQITSWRGGKPPRFRSFAGFIVGSIASGFGDDREAVSDQIDRVVGSAIGLVARLADAPGDADKIADASLFEPVAHFVEQGDAVPLRIRFPCLAFAAVVIGGNRDVGDVLAGVDPAEPSDDVKFDDVLHCLSPDRVR